MRVFVRMTGNSDELVVEGAKDIPHPPNQVAPNPAIHPNGALVVLTESGDDVIVAAGHWEAAFIEHENRDRLAKPHLLSPN